MAIPPGSSHKPPILDLRTATLIVAANDSLHRQMADYVCDGVSDQTEINLALNALPAQGGRVVLLEGTFNIDNPIIIPANNITLRGQGRSTLIDGDGLANNEHAIVVSGVTNCTVKKLAVQTEDGGGKVSHCIFVEDGANGFHIEFVTIVDSDTDGIRIEGTSILDGHIHNCHIDDTDAYGIYVRMDNGNSMFRLHIDDCNITGAGNAGIAFWGGVGVGTVLYAIVTGNVVYLNGNEGIIIWGSDQTVLGNNVSYANTQWGLRVRGSDHVNLSNNISQLNGVDGILLEDSTHCVVEGNVCIGNIAAVADGIQVDAGSTGNSLIGNHCHGNGRYGIHILGSRNIIAGNYVMLSGDHGIQVACEDIEISENYVYDNGQDLAGTYHGINLGGGVIRALVNCNFVTSPGDSQEDGIHLGDGASYVQIVGNYCHNGMGDGIELEANNDYCLIKDNYCLDNDDYGIAISAVTCDENTVENNKLLGNNGAGAGRQMLDGGTDTILPYVEVAVPNPNTNIGTHPAELLTDDLEVLTRLNLYVPMGFQELVRAHAIVVPGGTGDMRRSVATNFGKLCVSELYNQHTGAIAAGEVAVTVGELECIDISDSLTTVGATADAAAGDKVGMEFVRHGNHVNDTVGANCYLVGLRMQYV